MHSISIILRIFKNPYFYIIFQKSNVSEEEDYSYAGLPCPKPKCESGRTLVRTEIETLNGCPFYKCLISDESDECTKPDCPDGEFEYKNYSTYGVIKEYFNLVMK